MRWLPLSGLAFVACFGIAVGLYGGGAGSGASQIVAYYADHGNRMRQIGGFAALLVGCVFFAVYAAVLCREVVQEGPLATIAAISGGGAALLLAVGNALWAGSAFTAEMETGYRMSPQAHLLAEDTAFVIVVSAMVIAIPMVLVTSLAAWRSRRLPRWFAALGLLAAVGLAAGYWYVPLAAFLAWIGCGSVLLTATTRRRAAPHSRASAHE